MKKFVIQVFAVLIVIFAALFFTTRQTTINVAPGTQTAQPNGQELTVGDTVVKYELANTPEKRSKGLGDRDSLASDSGMLFTFDKPDRYSFWMKGMRFPLDFIWISNNVVVDIIKNAPPPLQGQKDETLPIYLPNSDIDSMLEVNAGFVDGHGIKVGDTVELAP